MNIFSPKRILVCALMLFTVIGLSCKSKSKESADANDTRPAPETTETSADNNVAEPLVLEETPTGVAVTVNGVDIMEEEIQVPLQQQLKKLTQQSKQLPPAIMSAYKKQLRQQILESFIIRQLMNEKVKEAQIVITEKEADEQISNIISAQKQPMTLDEFKKRLAANGQNFDDLKEQLRQGLAIQKYMESQWTDKINVTEEDAKKYYDENPAKFEVKEQVRASHILIQPDDFPGSDPNQAKAQAKEKIQKLLEQVKAGADFAELARNHSSCSSSADGGDLKFFTRGMMVAPFEEAAFNLKPGQTSDIVETRFGYHIIKVTDHKNAAKTTYDQAKAGLMQQLKQEKQAEFANEFIESLKAQANIVYPPGKEPVPIRQQ